MPMPPLPLILLLLSSIHGTYSAARSESCAAASPCGNITVDYPFALYDPYSSTTDSTYCGYPGLRIYCYDQRAPLLFLCSDNYTITDVSYMARTISLVDTDILLQSQYSASAPTIDHNVSIAPNTWLNYTDLVINITFFLNCPTFGPTFANSSFAAANSKPGKYSYIIPTATIPHDHSSYWVKECEEVVVAPTLGPILNDQVQNLSSAYDTVLLQGFQLEWRDESDSEFCTQCESRGGDCGYDVTGDYSSYNLTCLLNGKKGHTAVVIGVSVAAAATFFLLFIVCAVLYILRKTRAASYAIENKTFCFGTKERKMEKLVQVTLESFGSLSPKRYSFSEIRRITKSFNQKIGQGGYASVFKGELMDGTLVAVKVFKDRESSGVEFTSEVVSIARTSHVNIVRLVGFSIKGSKRALIYEFMLNGSLDKYLRENQNSTLSHVECTRLFEIAVGIARGLEYLHRGCNTRIVHFDIKPHNILLDQEYCPKISDFGLAKFCQPKESILSMSGLRGTIGYIAPEVFSRNFGVVSSKSDVYSYGMMVLEMFGGKQSKMELTDSSSDTYFPDYIYKCVALNNICSVFGVSNVCEEIVRKVTIVGLWCIQVMPHARPTMSAVLDMLDKRIEELALPPPSNVSLTPVLVKEAADFKLSTLSIS